MTEPTANDPSDKVRTSECKGSEKSCVTCKTSASVDPTPPSDESAPINENDQSTLNDNTITSNKDDACSVTFETFFEVDESMHQKADEFIHRRESFMSSDDEMDQEDACLGKSEELMRREIAGIFRLTSSSAPQQLPSPYVHLRSVCRGTLQASIHSDALGTASAHPTLEGNNDMPPPESSDNAKTVAEGNEDAFKNEVQRPNNQTSQPMNSSIMHTPPPKSSNNAKVDAEGNADAFIENEMKGAFNQASPPTMSPPVSLERSPSLILGVATESNPERMPKNETCAPAYGPAHHRPTSSIDSSDCTIDVAVGLDSIASTIDLVNDIEGSGLGGNKVDKFWKGGRGAAVSPTPPCFWTRKRAIMSILGLLVLVLTLVSIAVSVDRRTNSTEDTSGNQDTIGGGTLSENDPAFTSTIRPSLRPAIPPPGVRYPPPAALTAIVTTSPTGKPTATPSAAPTTKPTFDPTADPTPNPTVNPTSNPTANPTSNPTSNPTAKPTAKPTNIPTTNPTKSPTLPVSSDHKTLSFYVMGDAPYDEKEEEIVQGHLKQISAGATDEDLFIVHVGDLMKAKTTFCKSDRYSLMSDMFKSFSKLPVFVLPGDNDWNDCPKPDEAWDLWNENFMAFEKNWAGSRSFLKSVKRQNVREENFAFAQSGILFIGMNMVGGLTDDGYHDRLIQNELWIDEQLQKHSVGSRNKIRAVFFFGHSAKGVKVFAYMRDKLQAAGVASIYFQGDVHDYTLDDNVKGTGWDNFWRVVVDQGGKAPPLKVTVRGTTKEAYKNPFKKESSDQVVLNDFIKLDRRRG